MLKIENLTATVGDEDDAKTIINGLTLEVPKGEVHAIMGP
ncbi:MAG TPA: Fe-S cluster assembly ATPase SufC, partial [Hyphomonas atlantica]|nr:Fe-S cluster assembly ATPase SufC [Hyphomonas atlantica]